ncbi:MAG TPA: transglycosylase domain-containing protein, partial [Candidatus Kapabacteria bacterium]|nr:transglycosylase domain-containing protein [Candidatus Kapabacteria bacterium]
MTPLKFLIILCAAFYILVGVVGFWVINTVSKDLPSLEELEKPDQNLATRIISADGKVLDHFYAQKRLSLPFDSIPKNFMNALISVEDRDFYNHWGVYLPRVISTAINNIISMKIKAGASTITM